MKYPKVTSNNNANLIDLMFNVAISNSICLNATLIFDDRCTQ